MFSQFNSLSIVYGQSPTEFIDPSPPYTMASLSDSDQTGKKTSNTEHTEGISGPSC